MLRVVPAQPYGQTYPFEGRVVRKFSDGIIRQGGDDLLRHCVSAGKVIHGDGTVVYRHPEEQDIEVRTLCVFIYSAFRYVNAAAGLQIETE